MTLTELFAQLISNNAQSSGYLSADQLKSLTASASVDLAKPSRSVTLLYSGASGATLLDASTGQQVAVSNTAIAEEIGNSSGGMVRTIGQTDAGKFLSSPEFRTAAMNAFGGDAVLADNFIYGARDNAGNRISQGLFDDASARFIDSTGGGDFRSLTSFAGSDKVFGQTELARFMADPAATSLNGVAKEIYQGVYDKAFARGGVDAANEAVFNAAKYSSAILGEGVQVTNDGGTLKVGTGSLLEGTGAARQTLPIGATNVETLGNGYITGIQDKPSLAADIKSGGLALGEAEMSLLASGNTVARVGMTALGAGGVALAGAATIYTVSQINDALSRGDTQTANGLARQLTASWTGGLAGATASGSLAAELLSPLLAGGPVGGATYLVLVGTSALVGGYWGTEAANSLLNKLDFNPLGTTATTSINTDDYTNTTVFGSGAVLKEPISGYTDANGVLHIYVTLGERSSTLQVPDGNGGFVVIQAGATGSTVTKWAGAPDHSEQLGKIESSVVVPSADSNSNTGVGPVVNVYVGTELQSTITSQTDGNGQITGTTAIAAALDANNNPIANTYDIVNKDGTGSITATGQRTINPIDGSYTDLSIGAATPGNPNGTLNFTATDASGNTTPLLSKAAQDNLANNAQSFNDAYALVKAIQNKQPLPAVTSGLGLYNDIYHNAPPELLGASGALGALSSLYGLGRALGQGNISGAALSGANAFTQGVNSYVSIAYGGDAINAAGDGLGSLIGASSAVSQAVPYLNIANDLIQGNVPAAVGDSAGLAVSLLYAEELGAAAGPVGAVVGFVVGMIFGDIFGDSPPQPWGSASAAWDPASGTIRISAVGDSGGDAAARDALGNLEGALANLAQQYNGQTQPDFQIGIIPQRLGGLSYSNQSYRVSTIDPATGTSLNPGLSFSASTGQALNASVTDPAYFQSVGQYYINNALARQAIAPQWEVQTAQQQAANALSNAGLSEVERAADLGHLAAALPAGATTESWNPIGIDLGGALATSTLAGSSVQFNVDGTANLDARITGTSSAQYLKQTAWLNKQDGFLVLDKNVNGGIDNAEELFSNSQVNAQSRGIAWHSCYGLAICYKKRSCLRPNLLGCGNKRYIKAIDECVKRTSYQAKNRNRAKKLTDSGTRSGRNRLFMCVSSYEINSKTNFQQEMA